MRRTIALLASVAVVLVAVARPAIADPTAPSNGTPELVPTDAIGLSLSQVLGSGLAVTLDAGASEEHDLVVSNHTADLRLTVKLSATDATGKLGTAAAAWVAFGDDEVQLEPHAATTVPMTVAVPHDTQPGSDLAHVNATVETAVAAADGSPVAGTANNSFPVSITVLGTPTAQIAIADVHRVDQGSQHQLALVLRNFGDQSAQVSGHVRVAGDQPQTLPFHTDLPGSRDTTLTLDWHAPPVGTPSDIAVDLEYGGDNVASWSSRLGGAPTDLSSPSDSAGPTPTTTAAASDSSSTNAPASGSAKPWWKQTVVLVLAVLALLGAALWFGFEMFASRRRRVWSPQPVAGAMPVGWMSNPTDESIDLARQLVRLTEVIVQLVSVHRDGQNVEGGPGARGPDLDHAVARAVAANSRFEGDPRGARAGPAPPDTWPGVAQAPGPPDEPIAADTEFERSPSPTAGAAARPGPDNSSERIADVCTTDPAAITPNAPVVEPPVVESPVVESPVVESPVVESPVVESPVVESPQPGSVEPDPRAEMMERLVALDRQRRKLHDWMDAEESGRVIEPPVGPRKTSDS